jgi:hypothetical protein
MQSPGRLDAVAASLRELRSPAALMSVRKPSSYSSAASLPDLRTPVELDRQSPQTNRRRLAARSSAAALCFERRCSRALSARLPAPQRCSLDAPENRLVADWFHGCDGDPARSACRVFLPCSVFPTASTALQRLDALNQDLGRLKRNEKRTKTPRQLSCQWYGSINN